MIQIGFFKTYIQHFPKFEEYTAGHGGTKYNIIMHFHGMMMMGWVWMLLLQPILILKGKIKLHRRIGSPELCAGTFSTAILVFSQQGSIS